MVKNNESKKQKAFYSCITEEKDGNKYRTKKAAYEEGTKKYYYFSRIKVEG